MVKGKPPAMQAHRAGGYINKGQPSNNPFDSFDKLRISSLRVKLRGEVTAYGAGG